MLRIRPFSKTFKKTASHIRVPQPKPVTRLKKGEHTGYLGAWLAEGIDDREQIKRLEKIIKEVVHRINITRAPYAVCRYM